MRRRFINSHNTFDYSKYMTIEALEDGYEVWLSNDVEYNLNGYKWVQLKAGLYSPTLKKGDLLSLRCSLMPTEKFGIFHSNGKAINLRGNILSLIFKDDTNLDISGYDDVFNGIFNFYYGNNIISVEKNFLPATTLSNYCYRNIFANCKNLINAPELPATTLTIGCYYGMFENCTSLTTAPKLPATTLVNYCYEGMFRNCIGLTYIKMLATDIRAYNCTSLWVYNVALNGKFVKHKDMTSLSHHESGIPEGWVVVNDGEESVSSKTVNHGVLKIASNGNCKIYWEYPVENTITTVVVGVSPIGTTKANIITTIGNDVSTNNHTLGPGENLTHIESVAPTEDNIYIYEVTIE